LVQEKLPPHDNEAEDAVIGSLLVDGEAINEVASDLKPDDFFGERGKWIYEACLALYRRGDGINEITVARELAHDEKLEKIGGAAFLSHLISIVPTPFHIKYYGGIVSNLATYRRLISAGGEITRIGFHAGPDVDRALSQAADSVAQVRANSPGAVDSGKDFAVKADKWLGEMRQGRTPAVSWGFAELDTITGGAFGSEMTILAGRPGSGKTEIALAVFESMAVNSYPLMVSIEMSEDQLRQRIIAHWTGIPISVIRRGGFTDEQADAITAAISDLSNLHWQFMDLCDAKDFGRGDGDIDRIISAGLRCQVEGKLSAVIIDYLGLISDGPGNSEYSRVTYISRQLKRANRLLDVPFLVLCQLNRGPEARDDKHPQLSDLRDSGSIEQDADNVFLAYRPAYYHLCPVCSKDRELSRKGNAKLMYSDERREWYCLQNHDIFRTELEIAKQRQGDPGAVWLDWDRSHRCYKNDYWQEKGIENGMD